MRSYETIMIFHPELVGDNFTAALDKFKKILTDQGANIFKVDEWGTKKLAYLVKKQVRGIYVLFVYEGSPEIIAEYTRLMRLDEKVIKFQTILLEGGYEAPSVPEVAEEKQEDNSAAAEADSK